MMACQISKLPLQYLIELQDELERMLKFPTIFKIMYEITYYY